MHLFDSKFKIVDNRMSKILWYFNISIFLIIVFCILWLLLFWNNLLVYPKSQGGIHQEHTLVWATRKYRGGKGYLVCNRLRWNTKCIPPWTHCHKNMIFKISITFLVWLNNWLCYRRSSTSVKNNLK